MLTTHLGGWYESFPRVQLLSYPYSPRGAEYARRFAAVFQQNVSPWSTTCSQPRFLQHRALPFWLSPGHSATSSTTASVLSPTTSSSIISPNLMRRDQQRYFPAKTFCNVNTVRLSALTAYDVELLPLNTKRT